MWLENAGEAYYVGNKMMEVDHKIKCTKLPDEITLIPHSINLLVPDVSPCNV